MAHPHSNVYPTPAAVGISKGRTFYLKDRRTPHPFKTVLITLSFQGRSQDFSKGGSHWVIQRVLTRLSPEYCGLSAYKKAYKGGVTGTPGPPLATPLPSLPFRGHLISHCTLLSSWTFTVAVYRLNRINRRLDPVLDTGNYYMSTCILTTTSWKTLKTIVFTGNEVINILILQTDSVEYSNLGRGYIIAHVKTIAMFEPFVQCFMVMSCGNEKIHL